MQKGSAKKAANSKRKEAHCFGEEESGRTEVVPAREPRCLPIASRGIETGSDFAGFMSALISDVVESNVTPQIANAAVNAVGKLLKVVEMRFKYGQTMGKNKPKELRLT